MRTFILMDPDIAIKVILVIEAEEGDLGRVSRRHTPLEERGSLQHVIHASQVA